MPSQSTIFRCLSPPVDERIPSLLPSRLLSLHSRVSILRASCLHSYLSSRVNLNSSDSPHLQSSYSNYMNPLTNRGQVSRLASSQGPTSSSSYSSRRFLIIGEVFQRASFFRGFERPVSDREGLTPSASSRSPHASGKQLFLCPERFST